MQPRSLPVVSIIGMLTLALGCAPRDGLDSENVATDGAAADAPTLALTQILGRDEALHSMVPEVTATVRDMKPTDDGRIRVTLSLHCEILTSCDVCFYTKASDTVAWQPTPHEEIETRQITESTIEPTLLVDPGTMTDRFWLGAVIVRDPADGARVDHAEVTNLALCHRE